MAVIDELVTLLGLKLDPKAVREAGLLKAALGGIVTGAVAAGAALAAAAAAVQTYAMGQAESIAEGKRFADMLDVSFEKLQALEYAATALGGSSQELRSDLEKLTKSISSPIPGEYNQTLYLLGISARDASGKLKGADEVLLNIADKLSSMSKQRQLQFAERLGLSQTSLRLIQQGRGGIQQLTAEAQSLGIVLDKQTGEQALKFQTTLAKLRGTVEGIGKAITAGLLPALEAGVKWLSEWIAANRQIIASGIQQIVEGVARGFALFGSAVGALWDVLKRVIGPFDGFVKNLDATQAIAVAVAVALGGVVLAVAAWVAPFAAAAAGVAAFVVVLEDLYTFFQGGDSLIGEWVQSFTDAYPNIARVMGGLISWAKEVISLYGAGLPSAFADLWEGIKLPFKFILFVVDKLVAGIDLLIGGLGRLNSMGSQLPDAFRALGNFLAPGLGITAGAMASPIPGSVISSTARGGGGAGTPTVGTLNINGAGDPVAVGNEVARQLSWGESLQSVAPGMLGPQVG